MAFRRKRSTRRPRRSRRKRSARASLKKKLIRKRIGDRL